MAAESEEGVAMQDESIGYGIIITLGRETEPMSYGRGREPSPLMLLRRGRMHVFDSLDEAREALKATLKQAMEAKAEWAKPGKAKFNFVEVVIGVSA